MKTKIFKTKKGAHSLTAIKFILNVIAVLALVFGLRTIIENTGQTAVYSANQHFLVELNYIMFSKEGILPDRYTLDLNDYQQKLDHIEINDIGMEFRLEYDNKNIDFYLNQRLYERNYPLRDYDSYQFSSKRKPVLVVNGSQRYFGNLEINYIFKKEKTPHSVNKNS